MPVIFNIVNQQSRGGEFTESLDVAAYWAVHEHDLGERGFLEDCIENCSTALRVAVHCEVVFVVEGFENLLEHLERKGLDSLFGPNRLAIPRTVNGHNIKLFNIRDPHKILLEQGSILSRGVPGPRAMYNEYQRLPGGACSHGINLSIRCGDVS